MAKNTSKITHRITTKTLSVTTENFVVHPSVVKAFQIYCENFPTPSAHQNSHKPLIFDVIKDDDRFYFFDNFAEVVLVNDVTNVTIRPLPLSNIDIERRAWASLKGDFYALKPINPKIFSIVILPPNSSSAIFFGIYCLSSLKILGLIGLSA